MGQAKNKKIGKDVAGKELQGCFLSSSGYHNEDRN